MRVAKRKPAKSVKGKRPKVAKPLVNGQRPDGRFAPGNKLGRGNPIIQKVQWLREGLFAAVERRDVEAIAKRLVKQAKAGDIRAVHELLDRLFGKAHQAVVIEDTRNLPLQEAQADVLEMVRSVVPPPALARAMLQEQAENQNGSNGNGHV